MGVEQVMDVHHCESDLYDPDMAIRIRFRNGSSICIVANSYVAYSKRWQNLLEEQIGRSIQDSDMTALGLFRVAKGSTAFVTNLRQINISLYDE